MHLARPSGTWDWSIGIEQIVFGQISNLKNYISIKCLKSFLKVAKQWDSTKVKSERNHTVFVVTLCITTRQTAMNAFSSFYRTTGSCVLDMTQWWNEQSKANPPNSHRAASWCIQIQAAHQGSREQDTLRISLSWKSDAMSIGLLPAFNSGYAQCHPTIPTYPVHVQQHHRTFPGSRTTNLH